MIYIPQTYGYVRSRETNQIIRNGNYKMFFVFLASGRFRWWA